MINNGVLRDSGLCGFLVVQVFLCNFGETRCARMNMENRVINIAKEVSTHLQTRSSVRAFSCVVPSAKDVSYTFDFSGVEFASRSFMDEFYNQFLKEGRNRVAHMSDDLNKLLEVVIETNTSKSKVTYNVPTQNFDSSEKVIDYLESLSLSYGN